MLRLGTAVRLNPLWCDAKDSPPFLSTKTAGTTAGTPRFPDMPRSSRQLTLPVICALLATIGGLLGGATAVHGLHQNEYGPIGAPALLGQHPDDAATAPSSNGCEGCSERDLGYRWATLADVRSSADCPDDSWGFRRGCLDYTGGI